MSKYVVPLAHPKPDIDAFLATIAGKAAPKRPPLIEYLVDDSLMKPILTDMIGRAWIDPPELEDQTGGQMDLSHQKNTDARLDNVIEFWYRMGYDFVRIEACAPLPAAPLLAPDATAGNEQHTRAWQGLHEGPIKTWADIERYPWPKLTDADFYIYEYINNHLPSGMGLLCTHAGGVYEHTSRLLGYENLCYQLVDAPALVKAVADRLGQHISDYTARLVQFEKVAAIFPGEDLGFNTQTLIPPDAIRQYFLPWHKKFAAQAHAAGKRYFMHSCGQISAIMDDLINDVKIDAKHSFQDCILPVTEAKKRYGNRIGILGGVDIDQLTRLDVTALRKYVRNIIDACAPGGRYALGSGNSIPSYIPLDNYLTMLDETLR